MYILKYNLNIWMYLLFHPCQQIGVLPVKPPSEQANPARPTWSPARSKRARQAVRAGQPRAPGPANPRSEAHSSASSTRKRWRPTNTRASSVRLSDHDCIVPPRLKDVEITFKFTPSFALSCLLILITSLSVPPQRLFQLYSRGVNQ